MLTSRVSYGRLSALLKGTSEDIWPCRLRYSNQRLIGYWPSTLITRLPDETIHTSMHTWTHARKHTHKHMFKIHNMRHKQLKSRPSALAANQVFVLAQISVIIQNYLNKLHNTHACTQYNGIHEQLHSFSIYSAFRKYSHSMNFSTFTPQVLSS
jgi:hypothetical protein